MNIAVTNFWNLIVEAEGCGQEGSPIQVWLMLMLWKRLELPCSKRLTHSSLVDARRQTLDQPFADFWKWLLRTEVHVQSDAAKVTERVKVPLGAKVSDWIETLNQSHLKRNNNNTNNKSWQRKQQWASFWSNRLVFFFTFEVKMIWVIIK